MVVDQRDCPWAFQLYEFSYGDEYVFLSRDLLTLCDAAFNAIAQEENLYLDNDLLNVLLAGYIR